MPNANKSFEVKCPVCLKTRFARSDVLARLEKEQKQPICKPCHNKLRFSDRPHPRAGTGVKNDPQLKYTATSFYKAKQRSKLGKDHHPCYAAVEFRFCNLQELVDCIGIRPKDHTLDRIDPLGHYEPGNVRWATKKQQAENRLPKGYWINNQP